MRIIHREIVGAFIVSDDSKILLGKSRKGGVYPGCWLVPGGGVDEGETKIDALCRETLEETGIDINNASIVPISGNMTGESQKVIKGTGEKVLVKMKFYNYLVRLSEPAASVRKKHEDDFVDSEWFHKSRLQGLKLSPPTRTTLENMGWL